MMFHFLLRCKLLIVSSLLVFTPNFLLAGVIYDSIPTPLPGNVPSWGFAATSTSEFGDQIRFAPGGRTLSRATITMSSWAQFSNFPSFPASGWTRPLTLNLYSVNNSGSVPAVGSLLHSATVEASVPWHDPSNGFNGTAFNVQFDLPNVIVPDELIFGLSFNTQNFGPQPSGVEGPYNLLNFGLGTQVLVGTDVFRDGAFLNSADPNIYADGLAGGTFRFSTDWQPFTPAIRFEATENVIPEPATLAVFGAVTLATLGRRFRVKR